MLFRIIILCRYEWKELRSIEITDVLTKEEGDEQKLHILPVNESNEADEVEEK